MTLVDHRDSSARRRSPSGGVRRSLACKLWRLLCAIPLAAMLAVMGWPGSAFAQSCTGPLSPAALAACQATDQEGVLSSFTTLLGSPAGVALLNANLQTEENIYLNSTQAQKIEAAENSLLQYAPQSILILAFGTTPSFGYVANIPTATGLPVTVANVVGLGTPGALFSSVQSTKDFYGAYNIYGTAYGYAGPYASQPDINGDPRPFQTSSLIGGNPFTAANSSPFASQDQQNPADPNGQSWSVYVSSPAFPSGHSSYGNMSALVYAVLAPGDYQQLVQAGVDFAYSRNVFGAHYPLDVIGGRLVSTEVLAETLAGSATYPSALATPGISPRSARRCKPISAASASTVAPACPKRHPARRAWPPASPAA